MYKNTAKKNRNLWSTTAYGNCVCVVQACHKNIKEKFEKSRNILYLRKIWVK